MADTKITDLDALATAPAATDLFVVVDVDDTTMAATGTDKKITDTNLHGRTTSVHGIADTSLLLDTADIGATVQAYDADLAAIAALSPSNDDVVQRKSGAWTNRTVAQLLSDLAAAGTTFQPLDTDLTAIAALTTTSFGRALLELANAAALRTAAGLVIGTDVQAYSSVLANTTASFTTADETKLDGIETAADVTDATNVNAAGAVMESDYDANTILAATSDNTPAALTVAEQTLVGRITAGAIAALTAAQVRTLLNVEDGSTADQSAAEILAALLTVDGAGSLLDADLLDGNEASAFQPVDADLTTLATAFSSASASGPATLALAEDTDNGTNKVTLSAPSSIASDATVTVPATTGTLLVDANIGSTVQAYDATIVVDADIGVTVQGYDGDLAAIAALTSAADKMPYATGAGTWALTDLTAAARTVLDDASTSAMRTTLGVAIGTDVQAYDAELAAIAGLTSAADKLPYFTGSGTAGVADFTAAGRALVDDSTAADQRTTLGLGTIATQASSNVSITGGSVTGITDLAVADGGTGASDASGARTNLGLVIGTDVQAYDGDLADIAGITRTKGDLIVGSSSAWVDVAVGSNGARLVADSGQSAGLVWASRGPAYISGKYYETRKATDGMRSYGANVLYVVPFEIAYAATFDRIGIAVQTAGTGSTVLRLGIWNVSATTGYAGTLVLDAGTVDATTTGAKEITISQSLSAGLYFVGAAAQSHSGSPQVYGGYATGAASGQLVPQDNFAANSVLGHQTCRTYSGISGALGDLTATSGAQASIGPAIVLRAA